VKTIAYVIETTLTRITYDADEFGMNLSQEPPQREHMKSYYDGGYTETSAKALYELLYMQMKLARRNDA
jgi:hypothetical protein